MAQNVVAGFGFALGDPAEPVNLRTPGYILLIAGSLAAIGNLDLLFAAQAVMDLVTAFVTGCFVARYIGRTWGTVAVWLWACAPWALVWPAIVLTEAPATLALTTAAYWALHPGKRAGLWCGLALGAAANIRPDALTALPPLLLGPRSWRRVATGV